ncbi:hypothetical protein CDL12_00575 [Handroanthus impetiginosus]|uniref:Uncharacterized protein n=1 Tax=Handroanthus impetiginosus TaxID=429701 RepID=A0A2G9IA83_9LAMI|nr:hypothetical protein CDL12_00575 [Handroanthus impetiginosus]
MSAPAPIAKLHDRGQALKRPVLQLSSAGKKIDLSEPGSGKWLFVYGAKQSLGFDLHWDTSDSSFSWGQMQGVANPGDLSKLKDYTADHLVELGTRDLAREKYSREVKFGRKFLESVAGQNWTENMKADAVQAFKESEKFKNAVMNEAANIYEQIVYDCRYILHGTGRVAVEDLVLLDPKLSVNFNARGEIVCPDDADDMEDEDDDAPLA